MILRVIQRKTGSFPVLLQVCRQLSTAELSQLTPEAVLNDKARGECMKRLKLVNIHIKNKNDTNKAAVLVPLCIHDNKLSLLYTLRSTKVSMNRGQVSFPGGKKDDSDATLQDTALRETWEELQIPKDSIDVWGSGNLIVRRNIAVLPVLGFIGKIDPKNIKINAHEVEEAFVLPLEKLCDPSYYRYTQFKNNYTLPVYIAGNHKIWGLTAIITHIVLKSLVPDVYNHKLVCMQPIGEIQENLHISSKAQNS